MGTVFEKISPLKIAVRLTETQWLHIQERHPELRDQLDDLKGTVVNPDEILYSSEDDVYEYYKICSSASASGKILLIIAKHLNSQGFIITAFLVSKIKREGKVPVYGRH